METKYLKKYAPEARRVFIEAVTNKAAVYGLLPDEILPMQEEGDVVIIGDRPFQSAIGKQRKELESRICKEGFQQFIEAVAYTWFNRFVAIRYMELHGYLSHGYRVLSHPSEGVDDPEVMEYAERLDLPGLDREAVIDLKLDGQKDNELYRMIVVAQCNALHQVMPFMFEKVDDCSELLLPDNLLHTDSLVRRMVDTLTPESMKDIEAVGWLYQFYISEKKDEVFAALKKGKKITPENIPAATQLFTPHWIVRYLVENSLGRLWMLNHPDSRLVEQMDYYIKPEEPETDFLRISSPEEIKICDPACGSGHMLTYAFDLLYAIYEEQGYQATDIPRLILQNNLYGIEIDQRAGALAAFALAMKAREKYRRFLSAGKVVQPNICVLENIHIEPDDLSAYMDKVGRDLFTDGLQGVVNQFEEADNFGSLIRPLVTDVSEVLELLRERKMGEDLFLAGTHQKVLKALKQANYLSPKYHVVVANPPYMAVAGANVAMKEFSKKQFPDTRADLFGMFIERSLILVVPEGSVALITMQSWMFLPTFRDIRERLLASTTIGTMAHLGARAFGSISGEVVQTAAFVLHRRTPKDGRPVFFRLLSGGEDEKRLLLTSQSNRFDHVPQSDFSMIPSSPLAYWINCQTFEAFATLSQLGSWADVKEGINTGDNDRFMRFWWEQQLDSIGFGCASSDEGTQCKAKWFPCNKGGSYRKWYGNNEYVVNWQNDGQAIRSFRDKDGKLLSRIMNTEYFFRPGMTWSGVGTSGISFRSFPLGFTFNSGGRCVFLNQENHRLLCFLNSQVCNFLLGIITPTINRSAGDISRLPISSEHDSQLAKNAIEVTDLARSDWDTYESSWDFCGSPILRSRDDSTFKSSYQQMRVRSVEAVSKTRSLEGEINHHFIKSYGLENELEPEMSAELITLSCNPQYRYGSNKGESELEALLLADTMREFISYAVGCMSGRYSLDKPGLILANQGETADDYRQQVPSPTFSPDEDNVIPLLDDDWFTDDISYRFKEFLKVTFDTEHHEENLKFLEDAIGMEIHKYMTTEFFKHHLKMYKKRPIYWLFSSGKQKAFQALVYLHRYTPSTLSRMRTEYVVKLQGMFNARIEQLESDISAAGSTSHRKKLEKERDKLIKQREELQTFDEKLRHYADRRIELDLDDGVKVNYGKFGDLLAEVKAITGEKPTG